MSKNPWPRNDDRPEAGRALQLNIALAAMNFLVAVFCIYGFIASFEAGKPLIFQILYPVIGVVCVVVGIRLFRKR